MHYSRNNKTIFTKEQGTHLSGEDPGMLPARHKSPFYFLSILTISIGVIEAFIMLLLSRMPPLSMPIVSLVDSTLLIVFLSPMLYFFLRRPLLLYITALKQATDALYKSEKKYHTLIKVSPVGIFNTDADGNCTYINEEYCRIAGVTPEEAYGDKWTRYLHPEDRERIIEEWAKSARENLPFRSEYRFLREDGKSSWVVGQATAIEDTSGKVRGFVGTITDITDLKVSEGAVAREASINEALANLSQMYLSEESILIEEISYQVLEEARRLTGSRFGYVGYIDPETGSIVSPILTRDVWDQCEVPDKSIIFKKRSGLWGWVLDNKKPLFSNTPNKDLRSVGIPEGHIPLERFISAPALAVDKLLGQIALANADHDYTEYDMALVERIAGFYAMVIQRMWSEEALKNSEEKLRTITMSAQDAILMIDDKGKISFWNEAAVRMFGYKQEEALGKDVHSLIVPEKYYEDFRNEFAEFSMTGEGKVLGKIIVLPSIRKGGEEFYAEHSISAVKLKGKWHAIGLVRDVSERRRAEEEIRELATTERLTKLLNRFSFEKDEKNLVNPVLLLIDIDGFRHINDFYGIEAGNLILKEFTARLKDLIPINLNANIYKLGGDDFGVLFEDSPGFDPKDLVEKIVAGIEKKDFIYQDYNISLSISIGLSRERPILEKADMVLSYLKRHTRLKYKEYNKDLSLYKNISENMRVLNILKKAISRGAVISYFQPIVNNKTDMIDKYECLVRVIDEGGNVLSPFSFLQVAKEARLYGEITKRMIERGVAKFKDKDYEFSINISVEDINDSEIEEFMIKVLKKNPEIAGRITFEIIESEGIENYEIVYNFVQKVKKYGCKIAIDDFGAGYSNFSHTMQLNIDYLKIDASLIKGIDSNEKLQILIEMVVNYAKRLGIKTIAEYVHSEEVHRKVKELGVDYSQGYYIGEPKPTI